MADGRNIFGALSRPFTKMLSQNGADSTFDATGNYASAAVYWELRPSTGIYVANRMLVHVGDSGAFDADTYGNGIVLSNGILISKVRGTGSGATTVYNITDPNEPIIDNTEWSHYVFDTKLDTFGTGDNFLVARWTFTRYSDGVILDSEKNEALRIILNDDFTGLTEHRFLIQGYTNEFA